MSEARILVIDCGGAGLAHALLVAIHAQESSRYVELLRRDCEAQPTRKIGKTAAIDDLVARLEIEAPPIYYERRRRAQWKDEINRKGPGRRR